MTIIEQFYDMGFSIIPTGKDKKPLIQWKDYQERRATKEELNKWFLNGSNPAVICGKISGNLIVLDCDDPHITERLQIETFTVRTPSGGIHLYIKSKVIPDKQQAYRGYALDIQGDKAYALLPGAKTDKGEYVVIKDLPIKEFDNILTYLDSKLNPISEGRNGDIQNFKKKVGTALFSKFLNFEVEGHNYRQAKCPFHGDNDPSFTIYDGGYHCFGCGEHGDIIDFVMKIDNIDFKEAIKKISDISGIPAPEIKKTSSKYNITDLGNAQRIRDGHGDYIRYCYPRKTWIINTGKRWEDDRTAYMERVARQVIKDVYADAITLPAETEEQRDRKEKVISFALKCESANRIENMIKLARSEKGIPILPEALDTNKMLFNVQNGTIDLKTGELLPHRKEDMITKISNVNYNKTAECPTFMSFLLKAMNGDQELVDYIQTLLGYCLTGSTMEKGFYVLHGVTDTGKSTLMDILCYIFGDYSDTTEANTLLSSKYRTKSTNDLADMFGKRLICASETEEGSALDEQRIKTLTGGTDTIKCRQLYEKNFTYKPEYKIFLGTNSKPYIRGSDDAIWNRLHCIPFDVQIDKKDQDRTLPLKLVKEAEGILRWMVEGCLKWQVTGLKDPSKVIEHTDEYRKSMDKIKVFLDENYVREKGKDNVVKNKEMYDLYKQQDINDGTDEKSVISIKTFISKLGNAGLKYITKDRAIIWINIKPKEKDNTNAEPYKNESNESRSKLLHVGGVLEKLDSKLICLIESDQQITKTPTECDNKTDTLPQNEHIGIIRSKILELKSTFNAGVPGHVLFKALEDSGADMERLRDTVAKLVTSGQLMFSNNKGSQLYHWVGA